MTVLHTYFYNACHILTKLEFSRNIFEKSFNFHENPSGRSWALPCGRTHM